jgi:hypothetical protein
MAHFGGGCFYTIPLDTLTVRVITCVCVCVLAQRKCYYPSCQVEETITF